MSTGIEHVTWLLAILVVSCQAATASAPLTLRVVQTIDLPGVVGRIDHMSLDAAGQRLFVAALGNDSVEVIDLQRNIRSASIPQLREPQGVMWLADLHRLVVACGGGGECRFFDESLKPVGTIGGLEDADNVRYDARAKLLYVGYGQGALAVIDPQRLAKLGGIQLGAHPESFQLEVDGKRIFVNVPATHQVMVVDRERRTVTGKWPLEGAAKDFPLALDEAHHRLLVGCRDPAVMLVLDADSGKQVASLACCGDVDDVFYDAASKRVFLSGGEGCISVFEQADADRYHLLEKVSSAAGARTSLLAPESGALYVGVPHRNAQRAEIRVYRGPATTP